MEAHALRLVGELEKIRDALQRAQDQLESAPDETGWDYVTTQVLHADAGVAAARLAFSDFLSALRSRYSWAFPETLARS